MSGGARHLLRDLGFWPVRHAQAKAHVVGDRHVRVERVGLEHHGDAAVGRFRVGHVATANEDLAAANFLQPRDHAEEGGFAASRRPDEDGEFAFLDGERYVVNHFGRAEALANVAELDFRHSYPFTAPTAMPDTMRR